MIHFKGFNHGVYEIDWQGEEKPTPSQLMDAVTNHVKSDHLTFAITQSHIDHMWESWRRYGYCGFSLTIHRKDGRSYLHG
jgi:hypothetical protein